MRGSGGFAGAFALTLIVAGHADAQPVIRSLDDGSGPLLFAQAGTQARAIQGVNVRTGPGVQFPVVGTLQGGEIVGLAGCDPYWCQLGGGRGWVSRQYLAIGGEPATVASIPGSAEAQPLQPPAPPAHFTGAWYVQPSDTLAEPPAPEVGAGLSYSYAVPKPPPPAPPFRLLIAQAGDVVEGIAGNSRIAGAVGADGREARITLTTVEGEQLDGLLVVQGGELTGIVRTLDGRTINWRATRTALTR